MLPVLLALIFLAATLQTANLCADNPPTPVCQKPLLHTHTTHEEVLRELEKESDLNFTGHPVSYDAIMGLIESREEGWGWAIRSFVDEPALRKNGVRFDEIWPYPIMRAGGVSRRSSLRFILDSCGLAFYLDDATLIVTTQHIAKVKWLAQIARPQPKALSDPSIDLRRDAAFSAGYWQLSPDVWVGPLVEALSDSDRQVVFDAAFALGRLGPEAASSIDPLVNLLRSKDLTLREGAVFALGKIGPDAIPKLLQLVDDSDPAVGMAGAKALDVMGSAGKKAVPELIAIAKRRADEEERCEQISLSISRIDPLGAIPTLRDLFGADSPLIRAFAAQTIGEIGSTADSCAPDLLPLLSDESARVRLEAAFALAHLDLPADFPTKELELAAKDQDQDVRRAWALEALRIINSKR